MKPHLLLGECNLILVQMIICTDHAIMYVNQNSFEDVLVLCFDLSV